MTVVFLCVGAAKAGTTWLYRQLAAHPDCHLRSIKELHFFDALERGQLGRELTKHRDLQSNMLTRLAQTASVPSPDQAALIADRGDWIDLLDRARPGTGDYLDYLKAGAGQARVVGELTPAYALLPEERLREMAQISGDVRFVYLLRDPVERLWSHVRMIAARRDENGQVTERRCGRILRRTLSGEESQIAARSDYASALARLGAAVPAGRLLVEVFEEMVQGKGLERILRFLGLAPMRASAVPVHRGEPLAMTTDQRAAAARWLKPQYAAAEAFLGRVPQTWGRHG